MRVLGYQGGASSTVSEHGLRLASTAAMHIFAAEHATVCFRAETPPQDHYTVSFADVMQHILAHCVQACSLPRASCLQPVCSEQA
jgi:hypothetical protein